jgi:hypothetical protein
MPDLVQVARKREFEAADVVLVSYDLQTPRADRDAVVERVRKFVRKMQWPFEVLIYDAPDLDSINERFDLPGGIPLTLAFDKDGRLVDRIEGEAGTAEFTGVFESALGI